MEAQTQPGRAARWPWPIWILAGVLALVGVLAAVVLVRALTGGGDGRTLTGPPGSEFTIQRPDGWSELSKVDLEALPGDPLAVIRRDDGKGIVIVNRQEEAVQDLNTASRQLDRSLKRAIPDFQKVNARPVKVRAGPALVYSYIRRRKGTAHSLVVVPSGGRSYTLNAVVAAGADDVAKQVGKMLLTFDV